MNGGIFLFFMLEERAKLKEKLKRGDKIYFWRDEFIKG
jgi:hypothetical protein